MGSVVTFNWYFRLLSWLKGRGVLLIFRYFLYLSKWYGCGRSALNWKGCWCFVAKESQRLERRIWPHVCAHPAVLSCNLNSILMVWSCCRSSSLTNTNDGLVVIQVGMLIILLVEFSSNAVYSKYSKTMQNSLDSDSVLVRYTILMQHLEYVQ